MVETPKKTNEKRPLTWREIYKLAKEYERLERMVHGTLCPWEMSGERVDTDAASMCIRRRHEIENELGEFLLGHAVEIVRLENAVRVTGVDLDEDMAGAKRAFMGLCMLTLGGFVVTEFCLLLLACR